MAGLPDIDAAATLWPDPTAPVHKRCLAAKALAILGKRDQKFDETGIPDDESPLARVYNRAIRVVQGWWLIELRIEDREKAIQQMREWSVTSPADVIGVLQDTSETFEKRITAASILRGLRSREAVPSLIEALAEGHQDLSWMCMSALTDIDSRRGARRLIDIARGNYPLQARQEAVYTLWWLREFRAEPLFIRLCSALDTEEEYTRDMATEALGNTCRRLPSQRALAERLFDPSVSVRYSALCACSGVPSHTFPDFLRRALVAKLSDPDRVDDDRVIAELAAQVLR